MMKLEYKHDGTHYTFSINGVVVERSSNVHQLVQKVKNLTGSFFISSISASVFFLAAANIFFIRSAEVFA